MNKQEGPAKAKITLQIRFLTLLLHFGIINKEYEVLHDDATPGY